MRRTRTSAALLLLMMAHAAPAMAREPAETPGDALAQAMVLAEIGDWEAALALPRAADAPIAAEVILWLRLREGQGGWADYTAFLARNPDWPNTATLRRHAERAMPADLDPAEVRAFFDGRFALTGTGSLRHAGALAAAGRDAAATAEIRRAWREMAMSRSEQDDFLTRHGDIVDPLVTARLDMLLWSGLTAEATALLPRVPADWQALAEARIAVRRDTDGLTGLVRAVPASLRDDPGLSYERYLYRVTKGRWDDASAYLLEESVSAEALGRPDLWMERRANLARAALRAGDAEAAYQLAADNFSTLRTGADYADAEWVAGYVALTQLDDPARAVIHFQNFSQAVFTPISLGRAGYWLGRAQEAAGDSTAAEAAYAMAAVHQTSFYGQLAAERIGAPPDVNLAGHGARPDWRTTSFPRASVVEAGHLLILAGDDARAAQFLRHAAEAMDADQRGALAQMAIDLGRPHIGLRLAKDAAAKGVILPDQYYPLHPIAELDWPVPTELALAIARQESEFNPEAVSPVGARGLMQLMPATAREVADKIGIAYDPDDLTADPLYNARLGTTYLARMLAAWDGSYILAAASYNAGPGRARQWIEAFGDPRDADVDPIIWIESIPFEETRNYVMRVLEGLHVYRARLDGAPQPFRLAADLATAT